MKPHRKYRKVPIFLNMLWHDTVSLKRVKRIKIKSKDYKKQSSKMELEKVGKSSRGRTFMLMHSLSLSDFK